MGDLSQVWEQRSVVSKDHLVCQAVGELLANLYPPRQHVERRCEQRYPYPRLVLLTPVERDGTSPSGPSLTVVGRTISESGFGFYHPQPLAERLLVATFDQPDGTVRQLLMDVHRCRFTSRGWYESGGRFLRLAELATR